MKISKSGLNNLKINRMSTLETQYKNYLKENPNSKLTFEEWQIQIHIPIIKKFIDKHGKNI